MLFEVCVGGVVFILWGYFWFLVDKEERCRGFVMCIELYIMENCFVFYMFYKRFSGYVFKENICYGDLRLDFNIVFLYGF